MNDIRDFGDGKQVVLHTKDFELYRRLRQWEICLASFPYVDIEYYWIAGDLYYLKKHEDLIRRNADLPPRSKRPISDKQARELARGRQLMLSGL